MIDDPSERSGRGVPHAAHEPRVRDARQRGADASWSRARSSRRASRRRSRTSPSHSRAPAARRARRPRPAPAVRRPVLRPRRQAGDHAGRDRRRDARSRDRAGPDRRHRTLRVLEREVAARQMAVTRHRHARRTAVRPDTAGSRRVRRHRASDGDCSSISRITATSC